MRRKGKVGLWLWHSLITQNVDNTIPGQPYTLQMAMCLHRRNPTLDLEILKQMFEAIRAECANG
jgi:hypothetical protein